MVLTIRFFGIMALIMLGSVCQSCAEEWSFGMERVGSLSTPSGFTSIGAYTAKGLHLRCDVTDRWNVGVTGFLARDYVESGGADTDDWTEDQTASWVLASVGRRFVSARRLRCDVLVTGGYDKRNNSGGRWSPDDLSEETSWSTALVVRPEVQLYRNLWMTGQFGVRWVTTDSMKEDVFSEGSRLTITKSERSKFFTYGGFSETQLGLIWTF